MSLKKSRVNTLAKIAILSALAYIIMFFEVPLWFAPSFYKIDFSEIIVLIGAFALGPAAGVIIEALKILLNLLFTGTQTAFVGEIANFLIGISFVLPASLIYKHHKSKHNALIGMIWGTLCMTLVGALMNYYVLLPAYSYFFKMPLDALIAMGTAVNPLILNKWSLVLLATVPFNLLKAGIDSLVVMLVYKKVSPLLHR